MALTANRNKYTNYIGFYQKWNNVEFVGALNHADGSIAFI